MSQAKLNAAPSTASDDKRRLLERWLARGNVAPRAEPVAGDRQLPRSDPSKRHEGFPLTDVQEAYWIGRKASFQLGNIPAVSYTESSAESLDVGRLERALDELVRRHDMLRAVISADGTQRVLPTVPNITLRTFDLRGLDPDEARLKRKTIADELRRELMTTSEWPLFRVAISRAETIRLHIAFDILFLDVQSVRIVVSELSRLYDDIDCELPPIGITFRELVLAERESRDGPAYDAARRYWLDRLDDLPPAPALPVMIDPGALTEPRFLRYSGRIPAERWAIVKAKAASHGITPTAVVASAFAEVLSGWCKTSAFTLNVTLYNRPALHPDVRLVVGDFTSLLLLKVRLTARSFTERALALQAQLLEDMAHSAFSGVQVMREQVTRRGLTRGTSAPVVFTSNLLETDEPKRDTAFLGDVIESVTQTPQVWLDHQVAEHEGALVFNWDCVEGLFPVDVVHTRMAEFVGLLTRLAGDERWSMVPDVSVLREPSWQESASKPRPAAEARSGPLLDGLIRVISDVLAVDRVAPDANLLALGLNSIGVVRIANVMEREAGVRPALELLFEATTAQELALVYERALLGGDPAARARAEAAPPEPPLLFDPLEREEFKRARHGVRKDLDELPAVALPPGDTGPLQDFLARRRTSREFGSRPVAFSELGGLLAALRSREIGEEGKYAYASAGGLYPVQVYLNVVEGRVESLAPGTYYYHPVRNALLRVTEGTRLDRGIHGWINRAAFDAAAFSVFLIADESAMKPMYGNLTRDFCMIEAGAMAQTLMLAAPFFELGLCSVGSVDLSGLDRLFRIETRHWLVHSLLGGAAPEAPPERRAPSREVLEGMLHAMGGRT